MKKILTIIALSIIAILAATTIILACVKYNFNVIKIDDVAAVTIYSGTNSEVFDADLNKKEQMNKVVDLYKKGSKQNLLNAIFQGNIGHKNIVSRTYSNELSSKVGSAGTVAIELAFNQARNLVLDGNEYKYDDKTTISYRYATILLTNTNSVEEYTIYLYSAKSGSLSSYYYKVTGLGSFTQLYDYITNYSDWSVA